MCVRRCRGLRFGFREKEISGSREQFLQGPGMWNSKEFLGLGVQAGPGSVTGQQLSFGSYGINPCKMLAISKRMYGRSILGIGRVDENVFSVLASCLCEMLYWCVVQMRPVFLFFNRNGGVGSANWWIVVEHSWDRFCIEDLRTHSHTLYKVKNRAVWS